MWTSAAKARHGHVRRVVEAVPKPYYGKIALSVISKHTISPNTRLRHLASRLFKFLEDLQDVLQLFQSLLLDRSPIVKKELIRSFSDHLDRAHMDHALMSGFTTYVLCSRNRGFCFRNCCPSSLEGVYWYPKRHSFGFFFAFEFSSVVDVNELEGFIPSLYDLCNACPESVAIALADTLHLLSDKERQSIISLSIEYKEQ